MTEASLFRWIALAGICVGLCIGLYHRLRADSGEPLARREEGLPILIGLRLVALCCVVGLILYLINPEWMNWSSLPLPTWARWLGVAVGGVNLCFVTWVFHSLGKNITDTVVTRREHKLIVTGPYRFVRHPFYLGALAGVVAGTLVTANWFFGATGSVVFIVLVLRTSKEEAKLIERFGDEYRDYMRRTGRFIPRFPRAE